MAISQLRTANFGKSKSNLTGSTGVGYTLYDSTGAEAVARTTSGVYQLLSGSGIYSAYISFPDSFNGSILWDTAEAGAALAYASEQYNTEENDGRVYSTLVASAADITFLKDMEGGRWKIDTGTNQMIFYKSDNVTVVATFDLKDSGGAPTSTSPFERTRV